MNYEYVTSSEFAGRPREEVPLRGIWDGLKENTTAHGVIHMEIARGKGLDYLVSLNNNEHYCTILLSRESSWRKLEF